MRRAVVLEAWETRPEGATVAEVAQSLGMSKASLERAMQRARDAGWTGYQTPPVKRPMTEVRRCLVETCDRLLLTDAVWAETTDREGKACYGGHGYCKACYARLRAGGDLAPRRVSASIWREEWEFLRAMDVSPEEASRRLGVSLSSLLDAA